MRVVAAVELADRFRIHVTCCRAHQDAFLELRLEDALERDEERRAAMAVPVGVSARRDLRVVDLDFCCRIFRERLTQLFVQHVAEQVFARMQITVQLEFQGLYARGGDGRHRDISYRVVTRLDYTSRCLYATTRRWG